MNEKIIAIVSRMLKVPAETISLDSSPSSIPTWTSLRHIELILALEQEFGVQFQAVALSEQLTVGELCADIQKLSGFRPV